MNKTDEKYIELYPSHWLYNAGVVGFLNVLDAASLSVENLLRDDGTVRGDISVMFKEKIKHNDFEIPKVLWYWFIESGYKLKKDFNENGDVIKDIWGTLFNVVYRGFFNANPTNLYTHSKTSPALIETLLIFINSFAEYSVQNETCSFCLKCGTFNYKNNFSSEHFKELGGSDGVKGMPNSFWNNKKEDGTKICDTCSFILLNRHLAYSKLNDYRDIFINAPSFKLMYYLNKFLNSSISGSNKAEHRNKRALLAMSVIEYASKTNSLLGQWAGMNIEIISQKGKDIEFFSLPYETVQLISNKQIAGLLSNIGEFKILNIVLDGRFKQLVDLGYQLLRIAIKQNINSGDWKYVNYILFLPSNRNSSFAIKQTANKILKLYALIETRMNKLKH